jgi:anti-sigma factor RsiW
MTDASQPVSGTSTGCPDFEVLSCFADGELGASAAAGVAAHLGGCPRCDTLTGRLREGLGGAEARPGGGVGGSGCIGEERLVLYASGGLTGDDRTVIAAHVGGCDPCVASLLQIHRRLGVLADAAAPIPAAVARRARAVLPAALAELAPARRVQPSVVREAAPGLGERLRSWLQMPLLAPLALAAMAVLAVAIGMRPSTEPAGIERSRALPPAAVRLRVTANQTTVYSRPSGRSDVVGSVGRGTTVAIAGEERDWYEVRLDDGRSGWIVREAFE